MLTEIQNDILSALEAIGAFKQCGVWQGDLDELLKLPQKTPSAHVVLAAGQFGKVQTVPPKSSLANLGWDVILIYQCLKDRSVSSAQGYGLIESVVKPAVKKPEDPIGGLTGLITQGGLLWPQTLELLDTVKGTTAYAIRFEIQRDIK
ncbi:hypothetical protein KI809_10740 [Geobacter pelophilus]|uniref:Uncharacterized protein n=1 Tax=Geoanaerobacter pelophilus TaxID=60036 RepID=A0AAW4LA92_9BACT|nr:hypothetical protein [Geoanaerobacter pelophilus]MBT0664777.1 hypothetical protein [Geoanaerobacter pelophilus]